MTSQKRSLVNLYFNLVLAISLSSCQATPAPLPILPTFNMLIPTASMTATTVIEQPSASPSPSMTSTPVEQASPTETQTIIPTDTPTDTPVICRPPNGHHGWVVYTVQAGDTLFSLAVSTNTNVEEIQKANCITGTIIYNGQPLYLPFIPVYVPPASTVVPPTAPPPGDPRIDVDPGSGTAGTTFTLKIKDFDAFAVITVKIEPSGGVPIVPIPPFNITMDATGNLDYEWVSRVDLAIGFYVVRPYRPDGTQGKSGTFVIVP